MDKDYIKGKKFFTNMRDTAQQMLDLIEKEEKGNEVSDDEVAIVMGKLMLLQMQAEE